MADLHEHPRGVDDATVVLPAAFRPTPTAGGPVRPGDVRPVPAPDPAAAARLPVYGPDGVCRGSGGPDPESGGPEARVGVQRQVEAIAACPPGPELDAWLRGLDLTVLPGVVLVEVVAAQARMQAHHHARMLQAVAELASRPEMSPSWSPLAGAPPTQTCVAGDELAMRLGWARLTATRVVHRATVLDGMLAATGQALATGHIDAPKAEVLASALSDLSHQGAHTVENWVLPGADQCSLGQLRRRVAQAVLLVDPHGAADRHDRARCTRRVTRPQARAHGMAAMWVVLAAEEAARVDGVLHHHARAAKALGDTRTLDQLRADGLRDLVVGDVPPTDGPAFAVTLDAATPGHPAATRDDGPRTTTRGEPVHPARPEPPPTATITPVGTDTAPLDTGPAPPGAVPDTPRDAPLDTPPGTPPGNPRDTHRRAESPTRCTTCSGRPGALVRVTIAASTLLGLDEHPGELDGHGPVDAVRARALAAGGTWQRIVTDPVTHHVLDVGRDRYRPPAALAEHVRSRDTTCAAPGCTVSAWTADLDHTVEYHPRPGAPPGTPLGRTDADNLGPLCRRHHRLKTDGGYRLRQHRPGLFEWTTPTGHRYLVRPGTAQNHRATTDPPDTPPPF